MKTVKVWVAVNKNQSIVMFSEEPKRNKNLGKWESNKPFVNSVLYKDLSNMIEKTPMNWESNPQPFQLSIN